MARDAAATEEKWDSPVGVPDPPHRSEAPGFAPAPGTQRSPRLPGLEVLRALAALLVVFLHAGIPYMTHPLPYLVWPARVDVPSDFVNTLVWCTECFLMPLFYVLGGFFAQGLLTSRGQRQFLAERTRRLLPTQFAIGFTVLPVCLLIWCLGWVADGLYVPQDWWNTGLPVELDEELWGVAHLWFLQNLYLYCLVLVGVSWGLRQRGDGAEWPRWIRWGFEGLDRAMTSAWKPLIPAIPCTLILAWDLRIVLGFYQTYLPVISKWLYYAVYFFAGCWLHRHGATLARHARHGSLYLALATVTFTLLLPRVHDHLTSPAEGSSRIVLAALLALFAWLTTFGLLAVFVRVKVEIPVMKYLADASFWTYLIHLPFVVLTQIAIAPLPLSAEMRFLIAGSTAITLSLLTYQVFVRDTWLGVFLDGGRPRRRAEGQCPPRESQACSPAGCPSLASLSSS